MSRQFFVLISSLLLSSCGLIGSDSSSGHTFESDYARVIEHSITSNALDVLTVHDMYSSIFPSGYDNSQLRFAFDIPTMASGDLTLAADTVRESYAKLSAKMSLTGSFSQGDAGDIEFKNVRGQFVTNSATNKYYGLIESLDIGGSLASVLEQKISTLKPYL